MKFQCRKYVAKCYSLSPMMMLNQTIKKETDAVGTTENALETTFKLCIFHIFYWLKLQN